MSIRRVVLGGLTAIAGAAANFYFEPIFALGSAWWAVISILSLVAMAVVYWWERIAAVFPPWWKWHWPVSATPVGESFEVTQRKLRQHPDLPTPTPHNELQAKTGEELLRRILSSLMTNASLHPAEDYLLGCQRTYLKKILRPEGAQAMLDDCHGNAELAEQEIRRKMLMWVAQVGQNEDRPDN